MSVAIRPYRNGGWEVDVRWLDTTGKRCRERRQLTVTAKSAAKKWAQERERELLRRGPLQIKKEVPTLEEYAPRFMDGHPKANRHKPGGIAQKEQVLRIHLLPRLGRKRLDAITNEDVDRLKSELADKAIRTVNNVLTVLSTSLKKAVEWGIIERMPCTVKLFKVPEGAIDFYDFAEFETMVSASRRVSPQALIVLLLGGEAGLRGGEMRALKWTDVNFVKGQITVERNDWKGQVTATKGGRVRYVPMTKRLFAALQSHRHLRSERVLCRADGSAMAEHHLVDLLASVARRANLRNNGPHILRHTFCSHLAMRSAPVRAIQELAGHRDLSTTQRYMHLSPSAKEHAIRLLEEPSPFAIGGDNGETAIR